MAAVPGAWNRSSLLQTSASALAHADALAAKSKPRLLVIGGGICGMLTAKAAADQGCAVTILDRDDLSTRIEQETLKQTEKRRSGTPQQIQPHVLLTGGMRAMEAILPGCIKELEARGAEVLMDLAASGHLFYQGAVCQVKDSDPNLGVLCASRRLVEQTIRDLLLSSGAAVVLRDRCRVAGLAWNANKSMVTGVALASGEVLESDVVIDCSGRFSRVPTWLEAAGWQAPPVQVVDAKICYSTAYVRPSPEWHGKRLAFVISHPVSMRGGTMLPAEGGLFQVILHGYNGDRAPTDRQGWLEYAASLPDPCIYELMRHSEILDPGVMHYNATQNQMRQFHAIKLPLGLLVNGDAAAALNPIYGQGMAIHSLGAQMFGAQLSDVFAAAGSNPDTRRAALRGMGPKLHRKLADLGLQAFQITALEDAVLPHAVLKGATKTPRLVKAYLDAVMRLTLTDRAAFNTAWGATHFTEPLSAFFQPRIALKVLWLLLKEAMGWSRRPKPHGAGGVDTTVVTPAESSGSTGCGGDVVAVVNAGGGAATIKAGAGVSAAKAGDVAESSPKSVLGGAAA